MAFIGGSGMESGKREKSNAWDAESFMEGWPEAPNDPDITRPKRPPGKYDIWVWVPDLQAHVCWLVEVR